MRRKGKRQAPQDERSMFVVDRGENGGKGKKKSASDWLKQRFFSSGKSRLGPPRSGSGGMESDDSTVSNSPSHTVRPL